MVGLGHGAEILAYAARVAGRQTEGRQHHFVGRAEEPAGCGCRTEDVHRPGRMIAAGAMPVVHRMVDPAGDLDADMERFEDGPTGPAGRFRHGERRRHHRPGRMQSAVAVGEMLRAGIVVVVRMDCAAVGECGELRRRDQIRAEDVRLAVGIQI